MLDDLLETVIPNLEKFPEMGRSFLRQAIRSVEVSNAATRLKEKLSALTPDNDAIREYVLKNFPLLYAVIDGDIYQLSFDFDGHWR